jgi:hypothetical protein
MQGEAKKPISPKKTCPDQESPILGYKCIIQYESRCGWQYFIEIKTYD